MIQQPKEHDQLKYVDRLIVLNNTSTLIARLLVDEKYKVENAVAVYRPLQIFNEDHDVFMRKWIPSSNDDVFIIPMSQILTMASPNPMIVQSFADIIKGSYNEYVPVEPEEEPDEEGPVAVPVKSDKKLH